MSDRNEREVELHRALAAEYSTRYGADFAREYQVHWNKKLIDLLPEGGRSVLDIGCGTGVFLGELVTRFPEVTGLDLSLDMLEAVPEAVARRCHLLCGPIESADLPPGTFDAVVCRGVLHHVADLETTLLKIFSLLRPGGVLVFSEPCNDSLLLRFPRWYWRSFSDRFDRDHFALGSGLLNRALGHAGFQVTARHKFGFVAFPLCSLSDILPVMRYLPGALSLARGLIKFDELCAKIPGVRNESWHVIYRAERPQPTASD